ncbi:MAG: hypothetical protein LBE37_11745 [Sphingobacterium sp.]|jgi:hypothetical protein|uniref:Uncharacterized protein n=1 Tax=Sphingobacterium yanglingense TaxID=1437280 RepID=A0A4R6WLL6_9SPHI|nr:protein-disulfide reductase DsbD family protein [Sphingobacterium yanglingense]MDR2283878.1 hypothetical protein [Sphingobacterium sp.]TDQ81714.1 hypothetical protein CLV99_0243 [Sphingobacterium yanglingense]
MKTIFSFLILFFVLVPYTRSQSILDQKIAMAITMLPCDEPTERDPVALKATLVSEGDSLAVIVKVRMAPEWHIYQYVPDNAPYVQLENLLTLPQGLVKSGAWKCSDPIGYVSDPNVLIHEEGAWFVQKVVGKAEKGSLISTGLYYQTCDHKQCLPPVEVKLELKSN